MNDDITTSDAPTGDGPVSSRPSGEGMADSPGDSPLATAPVDAASPADEGLAEERDEAPPSAPDAADFEPDGNPTEDDETPLQAAPPPATDDTLPAPPARPEPRLLSRGERESIERVRGRFAACGRCGYLITDLYLLLGDEALQEAMIQTRDGWLRLEGDERLRGVLNKAFGVRLDLDYDTMDGACPECRRRFVFASLEDGRARLKLHV